MSPEHQQHHKWCDIYQESLVAGRDFFRRVVSIFIIVVAYQSYSMGMRWWLALLGACMTWFCIRVGGRVVQNRHYERAENEWDKTYPLVANKEHEHAEQGTSDSES